MKKYIITRLINFVPLMVAITFLSFLIIEMAPGDYFSQLQMNPQISRETLDKMRTKYGLDRPLLVRYGKWFWRMVRHGDFGESFDYRMPVLKLIWSRAVNTMILSASSMAFTWLLAMPIGLYVAMRPEGVLDKFFSFAAFFGLSVPNFFLAFLLMYLALKTGWFPVGGTFSVDYDQLGLWGKVVDRVHHLVLPVFVLGTSGMAGLFRLMRGQVLEIKNSEYIKTARAKGLSETKVVTKHILKNALNPFVTMAGYSLGALLGGAALVEAVMNLQGLGQLMLRAVMSQDLYLVLASLVIGSVLLIVGNLLADLALTLVDPRIRLD